MTGVIKKLVIGALIIGSFSLGYFTAHMPEKEISKLEKICKRNTAIYSYPSEDADFNGDGISDKYYKIEFDNEGYRVSITYGIAQGLEQIAEGPDIFLGPICIFSDQNNVFDGLMYAFKGSAGKLIKSPINQEKMIKEHNKNNDFEIFGIDSKSDFNGDGISDIFYNLSFSDNDGNHILVEYGCGEIGKKDPDAYLGTISVCSKYSEDRDTHNARTMFVQEGAMLIEDPVLKK